MRALVVDDSRAIRAVIGGFLTRLGFTVTEAKDGRAALGCLEGQPAPDLLVADWNMPELDGLGLVEAVRARPELAGTRVLMVTTETELAQVTLALERGVDEYLMKPFTVDALRDKLILLGVLQD